MQTTHDLYIFKGENKLGLTYLFDTHVYDKDTELGLSLMCVYGKRIDTYWLNKYLGVNDIKTLNN